MAAFMLRRSFASLLWGVLFMWTSVSPGAELGFEFTASISFIVPHPGGYTYGIRLPDFSTLSGHLVYESNTPSYLFGDCDCKGYDHKQINGLRVQFDGLSLQADEYIIQVKNDDPAIGSADALVIWYPEVPGNSTMRKPLLINGSPVTSGSFRMEMIFPGTTFQDSNLPTNFDPAAMVAGAGAGTFGDGIPSGADVFFKAQSLASLPSFTSDHDLDGDVDGRDFLIWQRNVGMNTGDGDANSDLTVDSQDLEIWQSQYGSGGEASAAAIVPEPASLALLVGSLLICLARR